MTPLQGFWGGSVSEEVEQNQVISASIFIDVILKEESL